MSILIGMREGETMMRLLGRLPERLPRHAAQTKEAFFASLEKPFDIVVFHVELAANMYPWEWLGYVRERQPHAKIVIVPSEEVYDSLWLEVLERLAGEAGCTVVPLDAGTEETARFVLREALGDAEEGATAPPSGIVAAIWPAAAKDGATTIAVNTALTLARHAPGLRVGLLDLNLKNPELRVQLRLPESARSNVALRPKLQTGTLRHNELWEAAAPYRKTANLRVLPGTFRRDTAGDLSADMVMSLLEVCRETFDVTIADVAAAPDNAATVCAVRSADVRWLVATGRKPSYLWSWGEWYECYWKLCGIAPPDVGFVCNRYDGTGEPAERAAAAVKMPLLGTVPNVPGGAGLRAAEEGRPLIDAPGADEFAAAVRRLASRLSIAAGGEPLSEPDNARRPAWVSLLSGLFGGA